MATPVTDLRNEIESMEVAFEFLISYAGQGVGQEGPQTENDQLREYVIQFEESIAAAFEAARAVPDEHEEFDTTEFDDFLDQMEPEIEEALTVVRLLSSLDRITSAQVDNMNGMSVFQSVMMKFFFLDELTDHLER
jgi:hypothetical protein